LLENTGVTPAEAWFVGDSVIDVDCARASGCTMIFYGNEFDYDDGRVTLQTGEVHVPDHQSLLERLNDLCTLHSS
jgi:phosphoglycolate phosphatase-like HAD superfamily hydrolase